ELVCGPALADAGFADQQKRPAAAAVEDVVQACPQDAELSLTTDEWGVPVPHRTWRLVIVDQPEPANLTRRTHGERIPPHPQRRWQEEPARPRGDPHRCPTAGASRTRWPDPTAFVPG